MRINENNRKVLVHEYGFQIEDQNEACNTDYIAVAY